MTSIASIAYARRRDVLRMIASAHAGHVGGDFSVMEILCTLYYRHLRVTPQSFATPEHDRLLLSKGHAAEALYAILADRGFFAKELLDTYCTPGTKLIGHPNRSVYGVEMNTGSLGHGLSVGVGMALAQKMDGNGFRTYVVMGDGELAEGSVWEGAMAAGHYRLDNLIAIVDRNGLQISGDTESVMSAESVMRRFEAFGWTALEAQGNDVTSLDAALTRAESTKGAPTLIVAHTVKGRGVSFMENQAGWHHRVPTPEEFEQAMKELEQKEAMLRDQSL